jgi:hypothetical protein
MKKRGLQIIRHGWVLVGVCGVCGHPFVPSPELRRQSEAQERQLRDDFEKHTCYEDTGQRAHGRVQARCHRYWRAVGSSQCSGYGTCGT